MRAAWLLLFCACGTTTPDPRPTLDAYSAALKAKDAKTLQQLSEGAVSLDELAALADDPEAFADARSRLKGPLAFSTWAEAIAPDGRRVRLHLGPEGWRIAEGGLEPVVDTPERALDVFLDAAQKGQLERVRRVIPEAQRAVLGDDEQLRELLAQQSARIDKARPSLAKVAPGSARIEGELAYLDYGPGRTVRFRREAGRWRILDLE